MQYIKKYNQIVEYRKNNPANNSYTEKHHIIPRCLDGDNSKNNLVTVTTKEHYLLHHLLVKIYPKNRGLLGAFNAIKSRLNIEKNSNPYQCIRKCGYSEINTQWYGKTHTEETKRKMSEALKGRILSKEHKQKLSENNSHYWLGKSLSEETKRKLSESHEGITHSKETKQKISENNSRYWKGKHLSEETKRKLSESFKGRIWINNGIIQKQIFSDNIPEGFVKGMLKRSTKSGPRYCQRNKPISKKSLS